ncbi:uncharacterized protein TNCV_2056601 [Trichonephila clavipes]|nr:uncharacterized protein TNCV_2056601 [Trichonephila clavipes]
MKAIELAAVASNLEDSIGLRWNPGEVRAKRHGAAEGRPFQSRLTTTVRPCPYYHRSHLKESEEIPEEQRSTWIDSLPQNSLRRRSLSMEALDGDPADRSE